MIACTLGGFGTGIAAGIEGREGLFLSLSGPIFRAQIKNERDIMALIDSGGRPVTAGNSSEGTAGTGAGGAYIKDGSLETFAADAGGQPRSPRDRRFLGTMAVCKQLGPALEKS